MVHTCPICGQWCYCGGDADDCGNDFADDVANCCHCPALCSPDCDCHRDHEDFPGLRALACGGQARGRNVMVWLKVFDELDRVGMLRFYLLRTLSRRQHLRIGEPGWPIGHYVKDLGQRGSDNVTWLIVVDKSVADLLVARGLAEVVDEDDD